MQATGRVFIKEPEFETNIYEYGTYIQIRPNDLFSLFSDSETNFNYVKPISADKIKYDSFLNIISLDLYKDNTRWNGVEYFNFADATKFIDVTEGIIGDCSNYWISNYDLNTTAGCAGDIWWAEPKVTLETDQSFLIDFRFWGKINNSERSLRIFVTGLTPTLKDCDNDGNDIEYDTICLDLPIDGEDKPSLRLVKSGDIDTLKTYSGSLTDYTTRAFQLPIDTVELQKIGNSEEITSIEFKRLGDNLIIASNIAAYQVKWNPGYEFQFVDPRVIISGKHMAIGFRFWDILWQDTGTLQLSIPLGYEPTQVGKVGMVQQNVSQNIDGIITSELLIENSIAYIDLSFSNGGDKYHTPILKIAELYIPPRINRATETGYTDISNKVMELSINRGVEQVPTATIVIDNTNGILSSYINYRNYKVYIDIGHDNGNYARRFTGYVNEVNFSRQSDSNSIITLNCVGVMSKLLKESQHIAQYDGWYVQDAVENICLMAGISNLITLDPSSDFERLNIGEQDPLYKLSLGQQYSSLIESFKAASGYILEEDQFGDIIFANKDWRITGFSNTIKTLGNPAYLNYGSLVDVIGIGTFYNVESTYDINNISIDYTLDDVRTSIIVIGMADRYIPAEDGIHPAYQPGEPIVVRRDNTSFINAVKKIDVVTIRKPELNTPEACIYFANNVLFKMTQRGTKSRVSIIGNAFLHPGNVVFLKEAFSFANGTLFYVENVTDSLSNGIYSQSLSGITINSIEAI